MNKQKIIDYLPRIDNYNPDKIGTNKGLALDVEATEPNPLVATIIQVTFIPFTFTDELDICKIGPIVKMFNDPGGPISEEITKLTGITDDMVKNQSLDYEKIISLFKDVEIVVAHNVEFDRTILEKHVAIPNVVWGCTFKDIDYRAKFINSRALDYIAFRNGFWFNGHDSEEDTLALIHILNCEFEGKTYFKELMETVFEASFKVILRDTEFSDNSIFKEMWFKWDPFNRYWYKNNVKESEMEDLRKQFEKLQKYQATKIPVNIYERFKV